VRLAREISRRYRAAWPSLAPELEAAVMQMAEHGFYVSLGSLEPGVNGVAVMVDEPGAPNAYSIGLAGPAFRFPEERLRREIAPRLLALKQRIERQLHARSRPAGAAVA
jgi:DNA-binding IclR family transcriptional regulator